MGGISQIRVMGGDENKTILLVDDERDILEVLEYNFKASGFHVLTSTSAEEALDKDLSGVDIIILDVMLPGMSGFKMAMTLKGDPDTARIPIIFLTARVAREDVIDGLRIGVDDYVTKPFSIQELILRTRAVLRRTGKRRLLEKGHPRGFYIDRIGKVVSVDGKEVPLTRTEFELLSLLADNPGKVFSRQQLLDRVWPENVIVTDRSVDVGVTRLRKKLGRYSALIVTRPGFGYCFNDEKIDT